ncbi:elongation factor P maturation arginine rhamnosyltransferase EarP [Nitrogeniibacter mangrovi]|uniref:Protein-arginine rhamnosyltransferase n=1 Tax=Nitrogeniibacter mangrovi TaxID=2016596 RepID=A0A6C1BB48_9RHOO|nr:elongation factor P maturation arginine rhamnosyltransferase EarP [Nitrogeniibacter mangrovi]QID19630.1 elongation factor P maturation arginine rhamnosyltransferase EarP [Nitrogeniibacter mangrovi]
MRWDVFCRVVDNFGDIGVCWRLARSLANTHGRWVRLWVDDWIALRHLLPAVPEVPAPCLLEGVEIHPWALAEQVTEAAGCVIEAFACHLPEGYLAAMRSRAVAPAWINLEYLSAEAWIEDCHGLPSPDPATGLNKTFFFPGFTERTGGVLREPELFERRDAAQGIDGRALWLARHAAPGGSAASRWMSLFCYENAALEHLLAAWQADAQPTLLWVPAGIALKQVAAHLDMAPVAGASHRAGALTVRALPFLSMRDYDALLAMCDVNFVRGEDSFVRAQWAARPLVWQAYPQADATHLVKVNAFLSRYCAGLDVADGDCLRAFWSGWNQGHDLRQAWPALARRLPRLARHARRWSDELAAQKDLAERLVEFVDRIVK